MQAVLPAAGSVAWPLAAPIRVAGCTTAVAHATAASAAPATGASITAAVAGMCPAVGLAVGLAAGLGLTAKSRRRHTGATFQPPTARKSSSGGAIETFLVQGPVSASKLATVCAPLAAHLDLECLVLFSLGLSPELLASVSGGALGIRGTCPVYIADCYGIIGWDKAAGVNIELMEEGRGQEYGGVGGKGGEGVVVVAFRGSGHMPSAGEEGSLPAGCGLHMVVRASGGPTPPAEGVVYGGVAKACYKLGHTGDLVQIPQFAVSTPAGVVSSFKGDAGAAAAAALGAVPAAAAPPSTAGYFPCFMRGVNQYGNDGVEPAAFAANGLGVRLFGMFAHGELGPPQGEPVVCSAGVQAAVEMHSMTSILALYGSS